MGSLATTLRFSGSDEVGLQMNTLSLAVAYLLDDRWTLRGGFGRVLSGTLNPENGSKQEIKPGTLYSAGIEYMALTGQGMLPFVHLSAFQGGTATTIEDPISKPESITDYTSSDLRFSGRATWVVNNMIFPYISSSIFAGPVKWTLNGSEVTGSDIYHYQFALGSAFQFNRLSVFMEASGIGEKTLISGLSYSW
ncbi:MAG: hypothetical protein K9N38_04700 [Candidatus Marinimicrobia bacterium]|nr:hypothetical protein [Candidatus Neomarinimicrobiota bacterium]MCF7850720.1 hypothetical protein [Candidatus Neomarinimicrobiota bacterium]